MGIKVWVGGNGRGIEIVERTKSKISRASDQWTRFFVSKNAGTGSEPGPTRAREETKMLRSAAKNNVNAEQTEQSSERKTSPAARG